MDFSKTCGGCNRAFITIVLHQAMEYSRSVVDQSDPQRKFLSLPFPTKEVASWLHNASKECQENQAYQDVLGGNPYSSTNTKTYWRNPKNFFTWYNLIYIYNELLNV